MVQTTKIDIYSKGSVINHLLSRLNSNRIYQCKNLKLINKNYWIAECSKAWAEHEPLHAAASITGYGGVQAQYNWPRCIEDCPHYQYVDNFIESLETNNIQDDSNLKSVRTDALSKQPTKLQYPDKITFEWIRKHVPIKIWVTIVGLVLSAFFLGLWMGHIDAVRKVYTIFHPSAPSSDISKTDTQAKTKTTGPQRKLQTQ